MPEIKMNEEHQEKLHALKKQIIKVSIIDSTGSILLGLAMYARFAAKGNAFIPLLNDESVVMAMFIAGGAIMVWGFLKVLTITKHYQEIKNHKDVHGIVDTSNTL